MISITWVLLAIGILIYQAYTKQATGCPAFNAYLGECDTFFWRWGIDHQQGLAVAVLVPKIDMMVLFGALPVLLLWAVAGATVWVRAGFKSLS
ncbi:hypothetical protein [Paraburkholderia monticola]|uniref:hypothetical protein n=1 Tax=Paraburkholderia monticola TaxID=1399968 RepID=UPI000782775A|nr:hypothetical protein [Paraburkholderia monticola]